MNASRIPMRSMMTKLVASTADREVYYEVLDKRSGEVENVFVEDTVILKFVDDTTWEVKFIGPLAPAGQMFIKVAGSERDANGEPLAGPLDGSPSNPGGTALLAFADTFDLESEPTLDCAILTTVTTCEEMYGQQQCEIAVRVQAVPCYW